MIRQKLRHFFAEIDYFSQMCIVGLGIPQPIMLVNISDIGKKVSKEELTENLENKLQEVNSLLFNYKRVSTIVICKNEWTPQNEILTPTMKIKRNQIDKYYDSNYSSWNKESGKRRI